MIIIRTIHDVRKLSIKGTLSKTYMDFIEEFFMDLYDALGKGEDIESFTLIGIGEIIIIEHEDKAEDLHIPLLPGKPLLTDTMPEYVEKYALGEVSIYKIALMPDNDCTIHIFSRVGVLNQAVEEWLNNLIEIGRSTNQLALVSCRYKRLGYFYAQNEGEWYLRIIRNAGDVRLLKCPCYRERVLSAPSKTPRVITREPR